MNQFGFTMTMVQTLWGFKFVSIGYSDETFYFYNTMNTNMYIYYHKCTVSTPTF